MASKATVKSAVSCAERTGAYCVLSGGRHRPNASAPVSNKASSLHRRSRGYVLSFDNELSLASSFAYIAYAEDNPNCIPAVCLDQDLDTDHINVRIAINKSDPRNNADTLESLLVSIQEICDLMALGGGNN